MDVESAEVTNWELLPDDEYQGIPFGCLVVSGFNNLLVAGPNLSVAQATQLRCASRAVLGLIGATQWMVQRRSCSQRRTR